MRKLGASVLVIAILLLAAMGAGAQTADEVVQSHITAIGGADTWKNINTLRMTGSLNAGGTDVSVVISIVHNKCAKVEFTVNGVTGYQIITTKEGWNYSPMQGQAKPVEMTADAVKEAQGQLDIQGEFIDYKAKGSKVNFMGKAEIDGKDCFKLRLTYASGKEEMVYFDVATYYHVRSVVGEKVGEKESGQITTYSNFKKLPEGVVFPMTTDDGNGPIVFSKIELNPTLDEAMFKPGK